MQSQPPEFQPYAHEATRARYAALVEARELGAVPAGLGKRSLAFLIDIVLGALTTTPAIICLILLQRGHDATWLWPMLLLVIGWVLLGIYVIINLSMHGLKGVTAGKAMLGLRSVSVREQKKPGFWRIVLRVFVLSASNVLPVLGPLVMFLSSLWDPLRAKRSWLDQVADCWVIDTRAGLDPRDKAALFAARRLRDLSSVSTDEQLVPLGSNAPQANLHSVLAPRSHAGVVGFAGALAGWQQEQMAVPASTAQPGPRRVVPEPMPAPKLAAAPVPAPEPVPAPASAPAIKPRLVFDDGSTVEVPRHGVLGRAPEASAESADVVRIQVHDDERRISKTHLELGLSEQGCWVRDLESANGTELVAPDGSATVLEPGARVVLVPGVTVRVGGRSFALDQTHGEGAHA